VALPHELQIRVLLLLDSDKPSIAALLRKGLKPATLAAVTELWLECWCPGLDALPNLTCLTVKGITGNLPAGLQDLASLTRLHLTSDNAAELPAGLWALTRL
jgi:hypothetical protein